MFETALTRKRDGGALYALLIASVGISLGALREVAEWGFDQVAPGDVIEGKHDTLLDIILDMAAALLAGIMDLNLTPLRSQAKQNERVSAMRGRLREWLESLGDIFWIRPALLVLCGVTFGELMVLAEVTITKLPWVPDR